MICLTTLTFWKAELAESLYMATDLISDWMMPAEAHDHSIGSDIRDSIPPDIAARSIWQCDTRTLQV